MKLFPGSNRPLFLVYIALMGIFLVPAIKAEEALISYENAPTVFVTGASRGIGFALTKLYAEKGWLVIASCRNPNTASRLNSLGEKYGNVNIEKLDVTNESDLQAIEAKYETIPIDVLINNAGMFGPESQQRLGNLDYTLFRRVTDVNVYGPLAVSNSLRKSVALSNQKKIIIITSGLGSKTLTKDRGEQYFYRASKAAVNLIGVVLAADLKDSHVLVGLLNPGIVNTDLQNDVSYSGPLIEPEDAASALIKNIESLSEESNATMLDLDGTPMAW